MSTGAIEANVGHGEHHHHYDPMGIKIGMWLFLFTEILLFGALFIMFAVYYFNYFDEFNYAAHKLNIPLATFNTFLLLTSSMTVAQSISALRKGNKPLCMTLISITILCAVGFLVVKSFEWGTKFSHHLYPGGDGFLDLSIGAQVYFSFYYLMTGLHALHVVIGGVLLAIVMVYIAKDKVHKERYLFLENAGLYWHLVDLIWIYLFPLFYLIG